ncbi:MAG: acetylornithine deacetylase [Salinirussus sp.]|jgi:acetylornithine deacetylase
MAGPTATVQGYIEEHREDLFDLVARLVETPSVSGEEGPAQELVVEELESMGLEPDVWEPDVEAFRDHPGYFDTKTYDDVGYEGRPNVAARAEGAGDGPSLGLSGHVDVVPVEADGWSHDPWAATREDGRLYGRGACDMKAGLAANLFVSRALRESGVELSGDLLLQSTIDEEAGGTGGVLAALERGYRPDAAIIPEPFGVPDIGIASSGVMYLRVTVEGQAAHAAYGYEGENAVDRLARVVTALEELDRERKARVDYQPAVNQDPAAEGAVTNLNAGIVAGGDWPSTVPAEATVECRVGWPPGETREEVRGQVEAAVERVVAEDDWLAEHPPEVEWFGWNAEPHECDRDAGVVTLAREHATTVCGTEGQFVGGLAGLDERFYVNYYDIPCPTVGPVGHNLHGADESVELDSLVDTAKVLAATAIDFCGVADG